jgi:hypothetical protein
MLGRGDGVAEGRVHHDDALGGGGLHVDVVDADLPADDFELLAGSVTSLSGLQAERTARPSYWPMILISSSFLRPTLKSTCRGYGRCLLRRARSSAIITFTMGQSPVLLS